MTNFTDLGLSEPVLRALGTKGYSDPTPIQLQAIPALLQGRDILGIAQTGTGKTAAFSLPSLDRLIANPQPRQAASCRMLVLSPTRELAAQIADNMRGYAKYLDINVQCVFGGVPASKHARALVRGCDILVATPGRLLDLIDSRALTLRNVEIFVLDEADQMMDLGFIKPLTRVAALLPKERQSLFFSATMPKAIAELGKRFINNPVRVEVAPQATTAERVEQYVTFVNQAEKQALLTLRLRAGLADQTIDRALVFSRTKHGADRIVRHLVTAGINAAAIHGNKSQAQRTAALGAFRQGSCPVLIATDIAARGIDVSGVSHVFNFELPNVAEQYVHRIGRTARAGADGISISYVAPDEKAYLRDIEKLTRIKLEPLSLPDDFAKEASRLPAPTRRVESVVGPGGRRARPEGRGDRHDRSDGRQNHGAPRRDRSDSRRPEARNDRPASGYDPMQANDGQGEARRERLEPRRDSQSQNGPRSASPAPRGGLRTPGGRGDYAPRSDSGSYRADQGARKDHAPRSDRAPRNDRGPRSDSAPRGDYAPRADHGPRRNGGGNNNGGGNGASKPYTARPANSGQRRPV